MLPCNRDQGKTRRAELRSNSIISTGPWTPPPPSRSPPPPRGPRHANPYRVTIPLPRLPSTPAACRTPPPALSATPSTPNPASGHVGCAIDLKRDLSATPSTPVGDVAGVGDS